MTHNEINAAINKAMDTGMAVAMWAYGITSDEAVELIREVWLVDAEGETMEASPECDVDSRLLLSGVGPEDPDILDVWGWSHETPPWAVDWRLEVTLVPLKWCDRCERSLPEGEYLVDGICENCQIILARRKR